MTRLLDKIGLLKLLKLLNPKFGMKKTLDENTEIRNKYLLEIDYNTDLQFDTTALVGKAAAPYVGTAQVGQSYVA